MRPPVQRPPSEGGQLVLDLDQAEVTRDREHELARLPRLLGLPGGRKPSERAHVMQASGAESERNCSVIART
jgi:hypothetical protein